MATGATPAPAGDAVAERLRAAQDLYDRGEPLDALIAAVHSRGLTRAERRRLHAAALDGPLALRLEAVARRDATRLRQAVDLLRDYLSGVDSSVKRRLPVARRLAFHLVEHRDPAELAVGDELANLVAAAAEPSKRVRKGLAWYARLPVQAPAPLFRLRRSDLVPVTEVDDVSWRDGRLRVTGHAYLAGLSVRSRRLNRATLVLRGPRWVPPISARTRRVHKPEATHQAAEPGCNYDWAGFEAEIRPWSLRWRAAIRAAVHRAERMARGRTAVPDTTTWRADIVIWSRGARAIGAVRNPALGRTERPAGLRVRPGWWVRPAWTSDRALQVVLQPTRAVLTGTAHHGDQIELTGFLPGATVTKGRARLGGHRMAADFTPGEGGTTFTVALAVPALMKERDARRLWIEPKGDPAAPVMMEADGEARVGLDRSEVTVLRDRRDRVVVSAHRVWPVITSATWEDDGSLTLGGTYPDPDPGPRELVLRQRAGVTHRVPVTRAGAGFSVRLAPGAMPRFGDTAPLSSGVWSLAVAGGKGTTAPLRVGHELLETLDEGVHVTGGRTYRLVATRFDVPVLVAAEHQPEDERGARGLWALRRVHYPDERRRELRDATVYASSDGRSYSDNARAVYEERLRRGDDREHIWVVRDGGFVPPGSAELGLGPGIVPTVVREGSREHYTAMARSRHIVTNTLLPQWFRAREDQICVQTWHGSPLKRVGGDQRHMARDPRPAAWYRQAVEVANWDLLVTQSPWASEVLRRAFGYGGEILESGYPRNDVLAYPDRADLAAAIRRNLGVPAGKRVVLYAPTWRDYDRKNSTVKLDLAEARRVLGRDHVMLVRGHAMQATPVVPGLAVPSPVSLVRPGPMSREHPFAIDVTTYPDMADLLLVADVLITDYSSVMYDFAVTRRPMVFFGHDLERYRNTRGLYLDMRTQAPGPLLAEGPDVIEAVRLIDALSGDYTDRYDAFVNTYVSRDDGKATARLVDHVFADPARS
ncbi:CDP-glycerol glycerophosphotransferase family protein [Sphaerisporangium sp. TRM90804]|uniref:CDP-glycerol glycerophosphotransferase family protein n=1 Tax=Sphaerisporangium sp. TRM90804 TaxID=3031113 RepID=UPI00244D789B|nr:CDP-glycerol glycerophosphotransferase family protein [Sphaerisporangium sp. TRM90804]MDH2429822.1 CDP-glycerol glycerophosphotransferase family protein [Sphaerisporangium sp. TRM90804]